MSDDVPTVPHAGGEHAVAPGATIGRFAVAELLGHGANGVVFAAHDPDLDRRIAIKVLQPGIADARARMLQEGRALARVVHPHVLAIHDVGTVGDQVFIATELAPGGTLRAWSDGGRRRWREVAAMFVQAGRGLEAAHAAGLVHRDFKPENVLLGADGRPRVADFGLVASPTASPTGLVQGTPAYMAPEQRAGEAIDARADQYAFCVAFWEALHGARPGTPAAASGDVPSWLDELLRRGLARSPDDRWPSLGALLDAIEARLGRAGRRLRIATTAGAALAAGLVAALVSPGGSPAAETCPAPAARIAPVWSPARADRLRAAIATIDPARGAERASAASAVIERDAAAWSAMHVEACRATRVDGSQSDALLDLRMGCLDRRLAELGGTIDRLEQVTAVTGLVGALDALHRLTPIAACADTDALAARVPPPADPEARAEADAIAADVQAVELDRRVGRTDELRPRIEAAVARARALGHPPTLAEALSALTDVQLSEHTASAAATTLEELVEVAGAARDDHLVARALSRLVRLHGYELGKPEIAQALIPMARAAVARAGAPAQIRIETLLTIADFLGDRGEGERAMALVREAEAVLPELGDDPVIRGHLTGAIAHITGTILVSMGRVEDAIPRYEKAARIWATEVGPDDPSLSTSYDALVEAYRRLGRNDDELAMLHTMVAFDERAGETPTLMLSLVNLGSTLDVNGDEAGALPVLERALAIGRRALGPGDVGLIAPLSYLATLYGDLGRGDEALALFAEAVAIAEQTGAVNFDTAALYNGQADLASKLGRWDQALVAYQKVLATFEALGGRHLSMIVWALHGIGRTRIEQGDPAAALAPLERAVAVPADEMNAPAHAGAKMQLGRALLATGGDRRRARTLLTEARQVLAEMGQFPSQVEQIDELLASN